MLVVGFKLVAGAIASNAFTGVAIGVGFIFVSIEMNIILSRLGLLYLN